MAKIETRDMVYMQVITPSIFREIRVARMEEDRTNAEARKVASMEALAERFGAYVETSSYRRG